MTDNPHDDPPAVPAPDAHARARKILAEQSCFSGCTPAVIDAMLARATIRRLAKGDHLFRHGEHGDCLTIVLSGSLKVVNVTGDAKEVVLAFLAAGALIGEIAVLDGDERTADVIAMEPVDAVVLHRRDLVPVLRSDPDAMMALVQSLCRRLRHTISLVEIYSLETEARVAAGLVRLAREHGRDHDAVTTIELKVNQRDIGSHLGLTRETVSRTLGELKSAGLIEMRGPNIVILDADGLAERAEGISE